MGTRMAKAALDVGLVSAEPDRLIAFYAGMAGFEVLEPLEIPNVGRIHKLACGESILRVLDPVTGRPVTGAYVAGWIKRGPTGFIGTNKSCAMQTVAALAEDFNAGLLDDPVHRPSALRRLVRARQPDVVDGDGWRAIDAAEIARGAAFGRPRVKFTSVQDMLAVARQRMSGPRARLRRVGDLVPARHRLR